MDDFTLTGETQTRVFDFLRIKVAIKAERRNPGMRVSRHGSALKAARDKGYVPDAMLRRGNILDRMDRAIAYMEYVTTLLTSGQQNAKAFGEEIVMGTVTYHETDECGCPVFKGGSESQFIQAPDFGSMCIGHGED